MNKEIDEFMMNYDEEKIRVSLKKWSLKIWEINILILLERERRNGEVESTGRGWLDYSYTKKSKIKFSIHWTKYWKNEI